jgi:hypothetical protein
VHSPRAFSESLRFRAGKLDHFGPFLDFGSNEIAEISRRQRHRRATKIDQSILELRSASAALISLFSFSTTADGVALGAPMPNHAVAS